MGMFDTIVVADKLPASQEMIDLGLDTNNHDFQTKDLDNALALYNIQSGRLLLQRFKIEEWVEGDPKAKGVMGRLGYLDRKEPYYEDTNYHGTITFYHFINDVKDKWDCWFEYEASFTHGQLDGFKLIKFEKEDNSIRLNREKEWRERYAKQEALWYNKYIFHTKICRKLVFNVWYKTFNKIGNFFITLSHKSL